MYEKVSWSFVPSSQLDQQQNRFETHKIVIVPQLVPVARAMKVAMMKVVVGNILISRSGSVITSKHQRSSTNTYLIGFGDHNMTNSRHIHRT